MREFDTNGLRLAEFQGRLFEASVDAFDCSSPVFLRRFRLSDLLKRLDSNESSLCPVDVEEALGEIQEQFGKSEYGNLKFSKATMFWMGYFYRYVSYTREIETPFLFSLFKFDLLNRVYYVFHTQDMEWCIDNLLEMIGCDEGVFDKNKRLKKIISAEIKKNVQTGQTSL